jgi:hypothetical protein
MKSRSKSEYGFSKEGKFMMKNDRQNPGPSPRLRRTIAITLALAGLAQPIATIMIELAKVVKEIIVIFSTT